ncbi:zinc-ribbon domain-containing protein [Atopobiaceae bacterium 24-176]
MHCKQCGHENGEDARFCTKCGSPLVPEEVGIEESVEESVEVASATDAADASESLPAETVLIAADETVVSPVSDSASDEPASQKEPLPVDPGAPVPPASSQQTPPPPVQPPVTGAGQAPVPPVQPPVASQPQRGVLGQAWHDLTGSQGWFGRVFVLILMNLVPVLGWYVSGYMLQWGACAGDGTEGLPRRSFTRSTLWLGFLYAIVGILGALAAASLFYVTAVPVLGVIFLFCWTVVVSVYTTLAGVRMAIKGNFGAAFDLSDILEAFKRDPWGAIVAVFVPGLLCAVIVCVVVMIVMAAAAGSIYASSYYLYGSGAGSYYGYGMANPFGALGNLLGILGPAIVIVALVAVFASTFAQLWSVRAVGLWIDRNAPEWKDASSDERGFGFRSE